MDWKTRLSQRRKDAKKTSRARRFQAGPPIGGALEGLVARAVGF